MQQYSLVLWKRAKEWIEANAGLNKYELAKFLNISPKMAQTLFNDYHFAFGKTTQERKHRLQIGNDYEPNRKQAALPLPSRIGKWRGIKKTVNQ